MTKIPRWASPATNRPGIVATLAAVYSVVQAVLPHLGYHFGLSPAAEAAIFAALAAWIYPAVTPVKDPRDGYGNRMLIAPPPPDGWPVDPRIQMGLPPYNLPAVPGAGPAPMANLMPSAAPPPAPPPAGP